jgi:hypothetical protein
VAGCLVPFCCGGVALLLRKRGGVMVLIELSNIYLIGYQMAELIN